MAVLHRVNDADIPVATSPGFGAGLGMAREAARMERAVATMMLALCPALASVAAATLFAMPA